VRHAGPGDFVGETALLTGALRTADVVAQEDVVLWMLARKQFDSLLAGSISLVHAFSRALCERVTLMTQILEEGGTGMGRAVAGMRLGPYRVVEQVGAGGMAAARGPLPPAGACRARHTCPRAARRNAPPGAAILAIFHLLSPRRAFYAASGTVQTVLGPVATNSTRPPSAAETSTMSPAAIMSAAPSKKPREQISANGAAAL